jgi:hypothetical protein
MCLLLIFRIPPDRAGRYFLPFPAARVACGLTREVRSENRESTYKSRLRRIDRNKCAFCTV